MASSNNSDEMATFNNPDKPTTIVSNNWQQNFDQQYNNS